MLLRYLYDAHLAQASYLIGCQATGEALVVDPHRLLDVYHAAAAAAGLRITAVTETHIHADFASGARALAAATGAQLYLSDLGGADWSYSFPHTGLHDGQPLQVGNVRLEAWHTPGHTPEHLAFVVTDTANADQPIGLLSGDCVFVGDVGRPDLLDGGSGRVAKEQAAAEMYRSIQRLKALPDFVQVWPGHGAGSACGKALGAVPMTTLGYERRFSWAFAAADEASFTTRLLDGQPEPPAYFATMKRLNRAGAGPRPAAPAVLGPADLPRVRASGAVIVDTRPRAAYVRAHLPGTLSLPADQNLATWAGTVLPYDRPLAVIVAPGQRQTVLDELARIGLDNVVGTWGASVVAEHSADLVALPERSVADLAARWPSGDFNLLDVRRTGEYRAGHIAAAQHLPLQSLPALLGQVPRDKPLWIHCESGVRSALAASFLALHGWCDVVNVSGGFAAWRAAGYPVSR